MGGVKRSAKLNVFERDGWTCGICGAVDERDPKDGGTMTVDHIVPQEYGGSHAKTNLRTLCAACNVARRSGPPRAWFDQADPAVPVRGAVVARRGGPGAAEFG